METAYMKTDPWPTMKEDAPVIFLNNYRYTEEIRQDLERLTPKEQENYLSRLRGEDTSDNLREDLLELSFKADIYYQVLRKHGLIQEMEKLFQETKEKSRELSEWLATQPVDELPFQERRDKKCQKAKDGDLRKLAGIHNAEGRTAVYELLRNQYELCTPAGPQCINVQEKQAVDSRPAAMEKLIRELIGDRCAGT